MTLHCFDSGIFSNSWSTADLRPLFEEKAQVKGWLEVIATLAETQAKYRLVPDIAANHLAQTCKSLVVDDALIEETRIGFEQTNHSLLGLIRAVQRRCPNDSGEWLCYGATVQDITDTQTMRTLKKVRVRFLSRLSIIQQLLGNLADKHRNTVMCGRTHGQPGLPITFGFKAAGWLDEFQRHRQRIQELGNRLEVGQLCGGVGSLSSLGEDALNVQRDFCSQLDLKAPSISWTNSRDRFAEWLNTLAMITATADRIGHEVYNLQRPEIGELCEGFIQGTVGSITMPQKRNPELSEHLGTLSQIVRYNANQMLENLVHDHERDGRAWKAEWVIVPEACLATGKALALLDDLLANLQVNAERMSANLEATQGFVLAESIMLRLAPQLGKQSAHDLVYRLSMDAHERGQSFDEALQNAPEIRQHLSAGEVDECMNYRANIGQCGELAQRIADSFNRPVD